MTFAVRVIVLNDVLEAAPREAQLFKLSNHLMALTGCTQELLVGNLLLSLMVVLSACGSLPTSILSSQTSRRPA